MYIIELDDNIDDTTTRVVLVDQEDADKFFEFVYIQRQLSVQMYWDEEMPDRSEEEVVRALRWIEYYFEQSVINKER